MNAMQTYSTAPGRRNQVASAPPKKQRTPKPTPLVATAMKARASSKKGR